MSSTIPKKTSEIRKERVEFALKQIRGTQAEVAGLLELSASHLSDIKRGEAALTKKTARRFEERFGISAEWLLEGTGPFMLREESPAYVTGPLSRPDPKPPVAEVIPRVGYRCGHCHREVAPRLRQCPHCGAALQWAEAASAPE